MNPQEAEGTKDLLPGSQSVEDVISQVTDEGANKPVVTEVTSVAQEEQKTGIKQQMPTAEELVAKASVSMIRNLKLLNDLVGKRGTGDYKISRKGMNRVLTAILQLPEEGLPVNLQDDYEKMAFAIGQRLVADRFILTQHQIGEEMKRIRAEREKALQEASNVKQEGEPNDKV